MHSNPATQRSVVGGLYCIPPFRALELTVAGRLDEEHPATPGGSLESKPTWPTAFGRSATSAFLFSTDAVRRQ
jgi:hypothetical protein